MLRLLLFCVFTLCLDARTLISIDDVLDSWYRIKNVPDNMQNCNKPTAVLNDFQVENDFNANASYTSGLAFGKTWAGKEYWYELGDLKCKGEDIILPNMSIQSISATSKVSAISSRYKEGIAKVKKYLKLFHRKKIADEDLLYRNFWDYKLVNRIYTPSNIAIKGKPAAFEQPYSGLTYLKFGYHSHNNRGAVRSHRIRIGLTGPGSKAQDIQEAFHNLKKATTPVGWDAYQTKGEIIANYGREYSYHAYDIYLFEALSELSKSTFIPAMKAMNWLGLDSWTKGHIEGRPHWGWNVGNLRTDAYVGIDIRIGNYHDYHETAPKGDLEAQHAANDASSSGDQESNSNNEEVDNNVDVQSETKTVSVSVTDHAHNIPRISYGEDSMPERTQRSNNETDVAANENKKVVYPKPMKVGKKHPWYFFYSPKIHAVYHDVRLDGGWFGDKDPHTVEKERIVQSYEMGLSLSFSTKFFNFNKLIGKRGKWISAYDWNLRIAKISKGTQIVNGVEKDQYTSIAISTQFKF